MNAESQPAIVLVETDVATRTRWAVTLQAAGYRVIGASSVLELSRSGPPPRATVISIRSGDYSERLEGWIRERRGQSAIILAISDGSEDLAVAALRAGVFDYLKKPVKTEELLAAVQRLRADEPGDDRSVPSHDLPSSEEDCLVGECDSIRNLRSYLTNVAGSDSNVLVTGETGTGKELVARLIHKHSNRRRKPFICVNCAAIPESLLESELFGFVKGAFTGAYASHEGKLKMADGGTILFDEIGDMPQQSQAKLLRAIEAKEVYPLGGKRRVPLDVRIIAATNQDIEKAVEKRVFRNDLYYRLNVVRIHIPPLRGRIEDVPVIVKYYLDKLGGSGGTQELSSEVLSSLLHYHWPGNVRELRNLVEAVLVSRPAQKIEFVDLPDHIRERLTTPHRERETEKGRLLETLVATRWNKTEAAKQLNWSRMTLYRRIAKYNLQGLKGR